MSRHRLCTVEEAPKPDHGTHFDVGEGPGVALFNVDGEFYAIEDNCPHMDAPLNDGIVARGVVTCMWHNWQFDLRTGESLMSDRICVEKFAVEVVDGVIFVHLPD